MSKDDLRLPVASSQAAAGETIYAGLRVEWGLVIRALCRAGRRASRRRLSGVALILCFAVAASGGQAAAGPLLPEDPAGAAAVGTSAPGTSGATAGPPAVPRAIGFGWVVLGLLLAAGGARIGLLLVRRSAASAGRRGEPARPSTIHREPPAPPRARGAAATPPAPPRRAARILVIDDEHAIAQLIEDALGNEGHVVEIAASGCAGLELAAGGDYDLVLTDLGMPDVSGWEVASRMRATSPGIPVVLVTGWGASISDEQLERSGIAAVVNKPFDINTLLETTGRLLADRRRRDAGPV